MDAKLLICVYRIILDHDNKLKMIIHVHAGVHTFMHAFMITVDIKT
jgi:hypothetical protein